MGGPAPEFFFDCGSERVELLGSQKWPSGTGIEPMPIPLGGPEVKAFDRCAVVVFRRWEPQPHKSDPVGTRQEQLPAASWHFWDFFF